jgi:hypothetical protein
MKRQRVGGVGDDEVPLEEEEEEVETEILPLHHHAAAAAVETVGGQPVVSILGLGDVESVLYHEDHYVDVTHLAVLRLRLNDASEMVRRLVAINARRPVRISNASSLLQASALRSGLLQLSAELSDLHQALRNNNCIVWELVDHVRSMPGLPVDLQLQPGILRDGVEHLVVAIRTTLAAFPAEPAGRHSGPNTTPATSHAAEVYTNLAERMRAHLDAMDELLTSSVDYPSVPLASFVSLDVEQSQETETETETVYKRIRGLDHLRLLLTLPNQGLLTEFCISQLHLGDADDMLHAIEAAMQHPFYYCFANFDRVASACEMKKMVLNISHVLQNIGSGLIDRQRLGVLEDVERKFMQAALRHTGAFREAALGLSAGLLELLQEVDDLLDAPADMPASVERVADDDPVEVRGMPDAHQAPVHNPAGLVALTPLLEQLLQRVTSIWSVSIEYADESLPDILLAKTIL